MASADEVARQRAQARRDATAQASAHAAADQQSRLAALQAEGRQLIRDALARQEQLGHPAVVERELSFRRMGLLGRRWVTVRKGCYPVTEFTQRESSTHGRGQAPIFLTSDGQIHIHAYVEEFDEFARRCFEARSPTIAQYRPAVFDAVIAGLRELSR